MKDFKIYAFIEDDYLYFTRTPDTIEGGLPNAYMVFNNIDTFENFIEITNLPDITAIVEL